MGYIKDVVMSDDQNQRLKRHFKNFLFIYVLKKRTPGKPEKQVTEGENYYLRII